MLILKAQVETRGNNPKAYQCNQKASLGKEIFLFLNMKYCRIFQLHQSIINLQGRVNE